MVGQTLQNTFEKLHLKKLFCQLAAWMTVAGRWPVFSLFPMTMFLRVAVAAATQAASCHTQLKDQDRRQS